MRGQLALFVKGSSPSLAERFAYFSTIPDISQNWNFWSDIDTISANVVVDYAILGRATRQRGCCVWLP